MSSTCCAFTTTNPDFTGNPQRRIGGAPPPPCRLEESADGDRGTTAH